MAARSGSACREKAFVVGKIRVSLPGKGRGETGEPAGKRRSHGRKIRVSLPGKGTVVSLPREGTVVSLAGKGTVNLWSFSNWRIMGLRDITPGGASSLNLKTSDEIGQHVAYGQELGKRYPGLFAGATKLIVC